MARVFRDFWVQGTLTISNHLTTEFCNFLPQSSTNMGKPACLSVSCISGSPQGLVNLSVSEFQEFWGFGLKFRQKDDQGFWGFWVQDSPSFIWICDQGFGIRDNHSMKLIAPLESLDHSISQFFAPKINQNGKTGRLSVWCISWSTFDAQGLANLSLCASELSQEFWSFGFKTV